MAGDNDDERCLFVSNLDRNVTDEILFELFLQAGPIEECTIENQSKSTRVGVIVYKHPNSVDYAKAIFEGTKLFGSEISMSNHNLLSYPPDDWRATLRGERHYNDYDHGGGFGPIRDRRDNYSSRNRYDRPAEPYNSRRHRQRDDDQYRHQHDRQRHHHHRRHHY